MDFAKKFMQKYGWKEGEGLGKNKKGISKALRANLKFDTAGLGVDKAADFNNHWWERVYNEAANNIDVKSDRGKVSMEIKDGNAVEITTKEYSTNKLNKSKGNNSYKSFLKTATLTNLGNEEIDPDRINLNDIQRTEFTPLTDEELFAACGGRTAHKGARHGLRLSGKLSRIEEQEKNLLAAINAANDKREETNKWTVVKNKKKKKDKIIENPEETNKKLDNLIYSAEYCSYSKKEKKEQKKLENNLANCLKSFSMENETDKLLELSEKSKLIKKDKKRKKKKQDKNEDEEWNNYRSTHSEPVIVEKSEIVNNLPEENCKESTKPKKEKKLKSGKIQKISTESKKNAKKLKKTLVNITEKLENSMMIL